MDVETVTRSTRVPATFGPQLTSRTHSPLGWTESTCPQYQVPLLEKESNETPNHRFSTISSFEQVASITTINSHENPTSTGNDHPLIPQLTNQTAASNTTTSKPKALPKRSCIVVGNTQYPLTPNLLAHPHMDHFFVKERKEIKPGHFLAKLVLQHHYLIM